MSKTIAALCLAIMLMAAMTACASTPPAPTAAPTDAAAPAEPTPTPEAKLPPLEITSMAMRYNPEPTKDSIFWKWMEAEFNVDYDVEWVPWDTYDAKLDLILASGEIPDVLQIGNMNYPSVQKAAIAGAFWELGPLLGPDFENYPGFKANTLDTAWVLNSVKGKMYLIPNTRGTINIGWMCRKDWLEALNMPVPTTIEEFANYAVAVGTGDLDGNGKIDSVGYVPADMMFDDAFGLRTPQYNDEGGLIYYKFLPEYADMIAYWRDMYERGGIAKEYALIKGQQAEEMFMNGTLGVFEKNMWHTYRYDEALKKLNPNYGVELILYLKGPKGYGNHRDIGYAGGHVFSKKMDEAKMKRCLEFFEKQTDPKYFNNLFCGVEGVHWTLVDGFPAATELGQQEITNSVYQPFTFAMDEWSKVKSPLAPADYNRAMFEKVKVLYDVDRNLPIWSVLASDTWTAEWPKVRDEFDATVVKAVTGTITMDEFRAYQRTFVNNETFKQAFREFAQHYADLFPNK